MKINQDRLESLRKGILYCYIPLCPPTELKEPNNSSAYCHTLPAEVSFRLLCD